MSEKYDLIYMVKKLRTGPLKGGQNSNTIFYIVSVLHLCYSPINL